MIRNHKSLTRECDNDRGLKQVYEQYFKGMGEGCRSTNKSIAQTILLILLVEIIVMKLITQLVVLCLCLGERLEKSGAEVFEAP